MLGFVPQPNLPASLYREFASRSDASNGRGLPQEAQKWNDSGKRACALKNRSASLALRFMMSRWQSSFELLGVTLSRWPAGRTSLSNNQ